jgi:hypothetical protein
MVPGSTKYWYKVAERMALRTAASTSVAHALKKNSAFNFEERLTRVLLYSRGAADKTSECVDLITHAVLGLG